jgi:hypothetical protein
VAEVFPLRDGVLVRLGEDQGTAEFTSEEIHPVEDEPQDQKTSVEEKKKKRGKRPSRRRTKSRRPAKK